MRASQQIVVAIDGPAGAGKSSVSKAVAQRLGLVLLDTGSMYRALAWAALRDGVGLDDAAALEDLANRLDLRATPEGIVVDGTNREREIREPPVSACVSTVAAHRRVRHVLVARQRKLAEAGGAVIEGRDIGSIVAPGADVKVFLTASVEERAGRRHREMQAAGHEVPMDRLTIEIQERDARDSVTTPLVPAAGAVVIDSTGKTLEHVVEEIADLVAATLATGTPR